MKKKTAIGWLIALGICALIGVALFQFGQPSTLYLRGVVHITADLKSSAGEPKALFITIFDANSPGGRPIAVYQERFSGPLSSDTFDFVLTPQTMQFTGPMGGMGGGGSGPTLPEKLFVKARIDQDGLGGPDQTGDLVGILDGVVLGSKDVNLTIDTKI